METPSRPADPSRPATSRTQPRSTTRHQKDRRWIQAEGRLYLVNLRGQPNPLRNPRQREYLAHHLDSHNIETLIVDPFGRAFTGANQNDAGEVTQWLVGLDQFARGRLGVADLILTAHAGWNAEHTRGSTALEDWADAILTLTKDDTDGGRYLRAIGRDVDVDEDRLDFDPVERTLTMAGTGSRKATAGLRRDQEPQVSVLDIIEATPGVNGAQVEDKLRALGVTFRKGTERKALSRLAELGRIAVEVGPHNSKTYQIKPVSPVSPVSPGVTGVPPRPLSIGGRHQGNPEDLLSTPPDRGNNCTICREPMAFVENGQTTHPSCGQEDSR